jgi:hypothetical protein
MGAPDERLKNVPVGDFETEIEAPIDEPPLAKSARRLLEEAPDLPDPPAGRSAPKQRPIRSGAVAPPPTVTDEPDEIAFDFELPEDEPARDPDPGPAAYNPPPGRTAGMPAGLPETIAFEPVSPEEAKPDPRAQALAAIDYSRATRADEPPIGPSLDFDLGDEAAPAVRYVDARAVNRGEEPHRDILFSLIVTAVVIGAVVIVAYFFGGAILSGLGTIVHNPSDAWDKFVHWVEHFFQP